MLVISRSLSFNSTLVRFKVVHHCRRRIAQYTFQFHIGSIQRPLDSLQYRAALLGFNSTLVRFKVQTVTLSSTLDYTVSIPHWFDSKTSAAMPTYSRLTCFNSTLVRFKAGRADRSLPFDASFNSTLVRFKVRFTHSAVAFRSVFQFHIGSIQSRAACSHSDAITSVSIPHWFDSKCSTRQRVVLMLNQCFNSTLVRFKAAASGQSTDVALMSFNSTLVRFKARSALASSVVASCVSIPHWFDSKCYDRSDNDTRQCVSIPHWFDSKSHVSHERSGVDLCFNSTLVRFKVATSRVLVKRASSSFNSTLVRFKDDLSHVDRRRDITGFNSTLVRFKGWMSTDIIRLRLFRFQFHIGSIQRQYACIRV